MCPGICMYGRVCMHACMYGRVCILISIGVEVPWINVGVSFGEFGDF